MGNGILWITVGIIAVIGGILALANPLVATLTATQLAAIVFVFVGVISIIGAFGEDTFGAKMWNLVLGVLALLLGISIFNNLLAGMLALTTVVGIIFLAAGITKVLLAFSLEDRQFFWLILLSGIVSVVLAVMIFANFPQSAAAVLGILLGVDLISNGVSLIAMGAAIRRARAA